MLERLWRRSNTARLLGEYPWMWAVRSQWSSHSTIRVEEVARYKHKLWDSVAEGTKLWAMFADPLAQPDFGKVKAVEVKLLMPIGRCLAYSIVPGEHLQYYVHHEGDDGNLKPYVIYRAARGESMHRFACEFLDSVHDRAVGM